MARSLWAVCDSDPNAIYLNASEENDEPAILSYAISSFCPTSADGLHSYIVGIEAALESHASTRSMPGWRRVTSPNAGLFPGHIGNLSVPLAHCYQEPTRVHALLNPTIRAVAWEVQ
jgi:hypothetical protein